MRCLVFTNSKMLMRFIDQSDLVAKMPIGTVRTLVLSMLLIIRSNAEITLFGTFQNQSGTAYFEAATTILNMTSNSFSNNWNSSQGLYSFISQMEKLRQNIEERNSSKNVVFSDAYGLQGQMIKEVLANQGVINTHYHQNKTTCFDNGLSGHYQPPVSESMLSVLDKINSPSKYVTIAVDKSKSGQETLTGLIRRLHAMNKQVISVTLLEMPLAKQSLISSALFGNDLFLVDCEGAMARQIFYLAEQLGVAGLRNPLKWVLSTRAMESLPSTCHLPDGKYYAVKPQALASNESHIISRVDQLKGASLRCNDNLQSYNPPIAYQLWPNPNAAMENVWTHLMKQNQSLEDGIISWQGLNPLLRRLIVSVAETAPWLMVSEVRTDKESDLPCGKAGRLGLRPAGNKSELVCFYGFAIDMMKNVEERMKFVGIPKLSIDGRYGTLDPETGKVDGMVRELYDGEADMAIDLIEDKTRNKVISFTSPYAVTSFAIAYMQQYSYKEADVFRPFSGELWLSVFGTIALLVVIVWIWERVSPYSQYQVNKRSLNESRAFGLDDSANYIMGTFFTGEIIDQKPKTFGSHVAIIIFSFVSILIISVYSANLITFLVVLDETPLISGLTDEKLIGESSKLQVGIHGSSVVSGYLASHSNPKIRQLLKSRVKHYSRFELAVNALRNRELDLILYDFFSIAYTQSLDRDCLIKVLRLNDAEMGIGLSFNKKFTWKRRLNLAAIDIVNSGTSDSIVKKWFNQQICIPSNVFYSLDIKRMSGLFVWLSVGILACAFIMVIVVLIKKVKVLSRREARERTKEETSM